MSLEHPTVSPGLWRVPGISSWPWLQAVVTTRHGGTSKDPFASLNLSLSNGDDPEHVRANRDRLQRALDLESRVLNTLEQVHGTVIHPAPSRQTCAGDGWWTQRPDTVLVIGVADCVPAFVWDTERRSVALVHAGWRGTAGGILGRALDLLLSQGSEARHLRVALGPSIGPCCYPVSRDVASRFPETAITRRGDALHLDLRLANRQQAVARGLTPQQVQDQPPCTSCHSDTFFSYRKHGARSGRMWALLWIRSGT